jgi:predicted HicB family RNase H-like nuclease
MPERMESVKLQIQIPKTLKENLEERAQEAGVSLNQYLMFLMVKAVDKPADGNA